MEGCKKSKILIKDIAERAGVSTGTASIVLNGHGDAMRISKPTQQRVLDAAREMNYRLGSYRRESMSNEPTRRAVAVFWSVDLIDEEMGYFFSGIHSVIIEKSLDIEVYIKLYDIGTLHTYIDIMHPSRYSGIIICGPSDADMAFLDSVSFMLPIVLMGRNSEKFNYVYTNYYEIGRNVAKLFKERGHERVGILTLKRRIHGSSLRQLGFLDSCEAYGLTIRPEWIQEGQARNYDSGYAAADAMLKSGSQPSAIFITAPGLALGCIDACRGAGLSVPQDMEILVFGDDSLFAHYTPSISAVRTPVRELAINALSLLMLILENNITMPMGRFLFGEYIFRESCGGFPDSVSANRGI